MNIVGNYTSATVFASIVDDASVDQIKQLCDSEFMRDCKVRIMPDVHVGAGCVIGLTIEMNSDKICPNLIGVDIGCGMLVTKIKKHNFDFAKLDSVIRSYIPSGQNVHESPVVEFDISDLKCFNRIAQKDRVLCSIGTLGSGNHFIEVCEGDNDFYLVIHSGSRNLGKQVADIYVQKSKDRKKRFLQKNIEDGIALLKAQNRVGEIHDYIKKNKVDISSDNLCYLENEDSADYLRDIKICQEYAYLNRRTMRDIIVENMGFYVESEFETIHNYINDSYIRKGSISAKKDEIVLIPINMCDGCLIAKGKGNPDWNNSAPHGAGRIMSRREARQKIDLEDYRNAMDNVYTTCVEAGTIDEAPMAYKPLEAIMNDIADTVDVLEIIKPKYNYKGF